MENFTDATVTSCRDMDRKTTADLYRIAAAATALLARIDNITTEDFSKGAEKAERDALRAALANFAA